jgi:hypothetical protein
MWTEVIKIEGMWGSPVFIDVGHVDASSLLAFRRAVVLRYASPAVARAKLPHAVPLLSGLETRSVLQPYEGFP